MEIREIKPEERAKIYTEWHEQTFEKVKFEPKPKEFLPRIVYAINQIWSDHEITRKALRLFFWACMAYLLVATMMLSHGEDLMAPRASHLMHQLSAGLFLLAVIGNFIYELGWSGGKDINKSHM